jgi:hypothetical protein
MSIAADSSPERRDDRSDTPGVFDQTIALADAVLYEGYVLYPYRSSSGKNRVRWQFGVLAPRCWIEASGPTTETVAGSAESWWQQTECLLEAADSATLALRPRFLQTQQKTVQAREPDGGFRPVERLELPDRTEVGFDEAVPRQADITVTVADLLAGEQRFTVEAAGGEQIVPVPDENGNEIGRIIRRTVPLSATVAVSAVPAPAPFPLTRLRIRIENADPEAVAPTADREEALRHALLSTHCLVAVDDGSFLSLLDPPAWATPAAESCRNVRTFPVLAGRPETGNLVLSAPIILYDHAQVAPESPGDLHDAAEIDELLSLSTRALTEDEKREARGTDPRAAAIIDRVDEMPPEVLERLHGAIRSMGPRPGTGRDEPTSAGTPSSADAASADDSSGNTPAKDATESLPWWEPGADADIDPGTDTVLVDGVRVGRGCRVRLQPRRRGTDAHDMFLADRTAQVEKVLLDVDGSRQLAVTIEDDPSAELHQWYGRFHYYRPDEVRPLAAGDTIDDAEYSNGAGSGP